VNHPRDDGRETRSDARDVVMATARGNHCTLEASRSLARLLARQAARDAWDNGPVPRCDLPEDVLAEADHLPSQATPI
jgi:hypothetical protein